MNNSKSILISLAFIFASTLAWGQGESFKDLYLKGKWIASCPPEILDHATMRECQLCDFVINSNNKSSAKIMDVEMNFLADTIIFNQSGKTTSVPYTRNMDTHAISFTFGNKQYNFRMFLDDERRILVDSDGTVMVLKKVL